MTQPHQPTKKNRPFFSQPPPINNMTTVRSLLHSRANFNADLPSSARVRRTSPPCHGTVFSRFSATPPLPPSPSSRESPTTSSSRYLLASTGTSPSTPCDLSTDSSSLTLPPELQKSARLPAPLPPPPPSASSSLPLTDRCSLISFTPQSPRLAPYLSFTQIKTLTLDFTHTFIPNPIPSERQLSFSSRFGPSPLLLNQLQVIYNPPLSNSPSIPIPIEILRNFNPLRCEFKALCGRSVDAWRPTVSLDSCWTRLESLCLVGTIPFAWSEGGGIRIAGLPASAIARLKELRFDFPSWFFEEGIRDSSSPLISLLEAEAAEYGLDKMVDGALLLVVESEQVRREIEAKVEGLAVLSQKVSVVLP